MTVRLSAIFEEHINKIIYNWNAAKRRDNHRRRSRSNASNNSSISSSVSFSSEEERSLVVDEGKEEVESEDSDNVPLTVLRSKTNTESDSTSQSLDKMVQRPKKSNPDSEEEYCPGSRRKPTQFNSTSSEEEEEEDVSSEESDDNSRKTNLRARPVRRKVRLYRSSESEGGSSVSTRNKRRRLASDSDSDSKSSTTQGPDHGFMSTVSSRGRVRKLTERAKALFKKR